MASERVAHNVGMHLKDADPKFSGNTRECLDEYVFVYHQMTRDYRLSDVQKLQYFYNTLSKDALRFYTSVVQPNVSTFHQKVNFISEEYHSSVCQARIKITWQAFKFPTSLPRTGRFLRCSR